LSGEHLPFALPDIGEREVAAVSAVLRSGWLTTGPTALRFEQQFSNEIGAKFCLAVNSATAAAAILFDIHRIGDGDAVVFPTWTFSSPAMMAIRAGAEVVLCDIEARTMQMDMNCLENILKNRAAEGDTQIKAVFVTHFAGGMGDMGRLIALSEEYGFKVFEDCAHALPSKWCGIQAGSDGMRTHGAIFSFYATKTVTSGEGGMLVVRNDAEYTLAKKLRLHGFSKDAFDRYTSSKAAWKYDVAECGHKANLTDMAAALGIVQLDRMAEMHTKREGIYVAYNEGLKDLVKKYGFVLHQRRTSTTVNSWHLYVIRVPSQRDEFIERMAKEGIGCSVHFIPLHKHSFWGQVATIHACPQADLTFESVVSLPIYSKMTQADVARVIAAVTRVAEEMYHEVSA